MAFLCCGGVGKWTVSDGGSSEAGCRSAGGSGGGRSSFIGSWSWGCGCGSFSGFGGCCVGVGGTSKETDFFGFCVSVVDGGGCGSCFSVAGSSSMLARRRNLSSSDEPMEDINSSRSFWICDADMESTCRRFSSSMFFLSSSRVGGDRDDGAVLPAGDGADSA